jgi:hypothetical protein
MFSEVARVILKRFGLIEDVLWRSDRGWVSPGPPVVDRGAQSLIGLAQPAGQRLW